MRLSSAIHGLPFATKQRSEPDLSVRPALQQADMSGTALPVLMAYLDHKDKLSEHCLVLFKVLDFLGRLLIAH